MTTPIDGRQLMRELQPRQAIASAALDTALGIEQQQYPSLFEDIAFFRFSKGIDIRHTTPELRFSETDQADPVGQYRLQGASGTFALSRALTANWATQDQFWYHDPINKVMVFSAEQDDNWRILMYAGSAAGGGQPIHEMNGSATGGNQVFRVGNNAGSSPAVLTLYGGTVPYVNIDSAYLDTNGNRIMGLASLYAHGNAGIYIRPFRAVTDATAYRTILNVLDPATDTEYTVAQAVPKAATPLFTMAAPDYVPTTSELDDGQVTFGYTKATDTLIMYVREGASVKTLVLGVAV